MARTRRSLEEIERREKLYEIMQSVQVGEVGDLKNLFRDMISVFLEKGLESELDESLGYSKYDYRNKETDNCRNGYGKKRLKSSYGAIELDIPRDRKGEFEPQLVRKNQTTLSRDIEQKILSMYAKGMTTRDIDAHIQIYMVSKFRNQQSAGLLTRFCLLSKTGSSGLWKTYMR